MDTAPHLHLHKERPPSPRPGDGSDEVEVSRALAGLIERFESFIRRTASRHGIRGADLDEVVQDLRVRIWRSFGTAEAIRRANPTYMYRAAVSAALDVIRTRRRRTDKGAPLDSVPEPHLRVKGADANARLDAADLAAAVHDALGMLHESRRAVVRMYLAGYDRFEIADLMGWGEGRTRNLLYRGLEDLRGILRARGFDQESHR